MKHILPSVEVRQIRKTKDRRKMDRLMFDKCDNRVSAYFYRLYYFGKSLWFLLSKMTSSFWHNVGSHNNPIEELTKTLCVCVCVCVCVYWGGDFRYSARYVLVMTVGQSSSGQITEARETSPIIGAGFELQCMQNCKKQWKKCTYFFEKTI